MNESQHRSAEKSWPDYRAVWRWHFYAGLFCIPFVVVLAVSGSTYLFKNEVESWIDRNCDNLEVTGVKLLEKAVLCRIPGVRDWLGLQNQTALKTPSSSSPRSCSA